MGEFICNDNLHIEFLNDEKKKSAKNFRQTFDMNYLIVIFFNIKAGFIKWNFLAIVFDINILLNFC